ncbi:hypothetical protein NDU88_005816 [Pleurodeles waltl]|uniref:Uncharacterized protein n=1 Tax=Pleurodeles waltl TaxID=8319 RepID=A0AAV7N6X8_PLEWA|nr:hypothetical protein NDU88_005816 [Pleurodeles waltl]
MAAPGVRETKQLLRPAEPRGLGLLRDTLDWQGEWPCRSNCFGQQVPNCCQTYSDNPIVFSEMDTGTPPPLWDSLEEEGPTLTPCMADDL